MAEALAEVRAAAGFLTRLPVGAVGDRAGAGAFGLVGAAIGVAGAVPLAVVGGRVPLVAAVLAVAIVVVVTGGVHLDGLADTADALAAPSPDVAERARTDPRLGAGGVSAIALDLALAVACLATLVARDAGLAAGALVVGATISRSAAPLAAFVRTRAGGSEAPGAGAWFVRRVGPASIAAVLVTTAVVAAAATLLAGPAIILGAAWGALAGAALAAWIVMRRGQLDGDGYGAIVELVFLSVLTGVTVAGALV